MILLEVLRRSQELGFLGPLPVEHQLAHAEGFLELLPMTGSVLDLGSGGGLPGLVIVDRRPGLRVTLLDANERRTTFLRWATRKLGQQVEILNGRAEVLAHRPELRHRFDVVVARSFGPPPVTAELGGAFLVTQGRLVVSEPPGEREQEWSGDGLHQLGLDEGRTVSTPSGRFRELRAVGPYPEGLPRDERTIRRRPWGERST